MSISTSSENKPEITTVATAALPAMDSPGKPEKKQRKLLSLIGVALVLAVILFFIGQIPLSGSDTLYHLLARNVTSEFFLYMLGGFIAQMVDGALGMAYGLTFTTFLLSVGISPAVASASVHASEVVNNGA